MSRWPYLFHTGFRSSTVCQKAISTNVENHDNIQAVSHNGHTQQLDETCYLFMFVLCFLLKQLYLKFNNITKHLLVLQ